ncbi:BetT protein [Lactiplantibacillus plantarum EGD-AQ4]|nr:BetT protein [Lactiplantibacillus plantarum EGD-AQ4]
MKTTWLASLLVTIFWGAILRIVVMYLGGRWSRLWPPPIIVREPLKAVVVGIILAVMSGLLVTTHH